MKIALIGYGGMGKVVARIAQERGHELVLIADPGAASNPPQGGECARAQIVAQLSADNLRASGAEVAIDFSLGEAVFENLKICQEAGVNLVVGTTGWQGRVEEVRGLAGEKNARNANSEMQEIQSSIGFLHSSNFSIGVNLYLKIVAEAAKMINKFDEYDIWGHEIHHYNKADSPSGTAKSLEKILLENIERKTAIVEEKLDRKREDHEIHFSSVRGGLVNFGHTIGFDSPADTITVTHAARSRDGYALGAVKAAEWLKGKKGYFEMEDFLQLS